ncbi:MAG: ROK family protein [Planctomycetota bacterium]
MTDANKLAIGIDVGGTFIKAGLVSSRSDVVAKGELPSEAERGPDHMIGRMAELATGLLKQVPLSASLTGIGLGIPGTLSHREGIVYSPPNLPGWRNVPVATKLAERVKLPVTLENDANCAAIAEYAGGAGRGSRHMVLLTLGTGVGGGIILDGKLWRGADECAAEIGHTIVHVGGRRCGCGQLGCLEAYASASSTAARAAEALTVGRSSSLSALKSLTAKDVLVAAKAGDALAREVWNDSCLYLAVACVNLHHLLNPDLIVLAGGMSAAGDDLLGPVREAVSSMGSRMINKPPKICLAKLGNDAGFIGAALGVFE